MFKKMLVLVLAGLLLTGCLSEDEEEVSSELTTLTIGALPATDNIPLLVAIKQGFDEAYGLNLVIETFTSAKDRDAAYQAGELDGISADLIAMAIYYEADYPIMITGSTYGQFDVVTGNDAVASVADLAGLNLGIAMNTSNQYAMVRMLESAGLSADDVTFTEVAAVPSRLELLLNQQIDAAILPQPYVTMAQAEGLDVLMSTQDMDLMPFIMAFSTSVIATKGEAIQSMYKAYNDAVAYMRETDASEYIDIFIESIGYSESLADSIVVPDYPMASQVREADLEDAFSWARAVGLLTKDYRFESIVSDVNFEQ